MKSLKLDADFVKSNSSKFIELAKDACMRRPDIFSDLIKIGWHKEIRQKYPDAANEFLKYLAFNKDQKLAVESIKLFMQDASKKELNDQLMSDGSSGYQNVILTWAYSDNVTTDVFRELTNAVRTLGVNLETSFPYAVFNGHGVKTSEQTLISALLIRSLFEKGHQPSSKENEFLKSRILAIFDAGKKFDKQTASVLLISPNTENSIFWLRFFDSKGITSAKNILRYANQCELNPEIAIYLHAQDANEIMRKTVISSKCFSDNLPTLKNNI